MAESKDKKKKKPSNPFSVFFGIDKDDPKRFQIGIQEYTFHRWINSGKLI